MKFSPCILCDNKGFHRISSRVRTGEEVSIVICDRCSLVQVNPRPSEREIEDFYKKQYHKDATGESSPPERLIHKSRRFAKHRLTILRNFQDLSGTSLLDIGCSYGEFIYQARGLVKKAKGIEPGISFYNYGVKELGLDIFNGTFDEFLRSNSTQYDIITAFNVIEHLVNPKEFLRGIHGILKDNGILFIEIPDFKEHLLRRLFLKKKFVQLFSPFHLQYFSRATIEYLLNISGFNVELFDRSRWCYNRIIAKRIDNSVKNIKKAKKSDIYLVRTLSILWKLKSYFI